MANRKDRGKDGKQDRRRIKRVEEKNPNTGIVRNLHQLKPQSGFRGTSLFCIFGHELAESRIPVTLENCAGNLYSAKKPECQTCGVCVCFTTMYRQVESAGTVVASLYPQKPVGFNADQYRQSIAVAA